MDIKYNSPYNTASTKYTGPYAIVSWDGPRDDSNNNCMEGEGKILFANGNTYEGSVKGDMLHGHGVLVDVENATRFDGNFVEDRRDGLATFTHPAGSYVGNYSDNKRHGQGKEVDIHGNTFVGRFENGEAVEGKMSYANGEVFVGTFKDDMRHGYGKCWNQDGELVEGEWFEDELVSAAAT